MKVVHRINLAALGLLAASLLVVGVIFAVSFRQLRAETYHWFDESARNLAGTIGNEAREAIAYFNYDQVQAALEARVQKDPTLLYVAVHFGEGLKERREAGAAERGPFHAFEVETRDGTTVTQKVVVHYGTEEIEGKLTALVTRLALGSLASLAVLLGGLAALVRATVSTPLRRLVAHAEVAAGGDLTGVAAVAGADEFATLASTLNQMTGNLRGMVEKVRTSFAQLEAASRDIATVSHGIAEGAGGQTTAVATVSSSIEEMNASIKSVVQSVEHLYALAGESSSSMLEMSASVDQVAQNAEGLSAAVEQASASVGEMTASMRTSAEHVGRLNDLVLATTSAITEIDSVVREIERNSGQGHELSREVARVMTEDGLEGLRRAGDGMREIRRSVGDAAAVIASLEGRSREIGSILGVINEVNDQTNLLALNAAILAAQAGEHGRGFAVVAEEIRELSARTASSTKEITKLIAAVQGESKRAVAAMEEGTRRVEDGARVVEELGATLRRAAEDSEKASTASRVIAQATTEQYKGIRQISVSAQTMTEMSQEIARSSREQSAGSQLILKAVEEVRDLAQQVKRAMAEQAKGIRLTSRASEESARLSQQVLDATREEAKGSDLVVRTVGSIQEITNTNAAGVRRIDEMVLGLQAQAEALKGEIGKFKIDAGGPAPPPHQGGNP